LVLKKIFLVFLLFASLLVCQISYAADWQNEIKGVSKKLLMDVITSDMISLRFNVLSVNEYQLVFGRDANDFGSMFFFGSKFNGTPQQRVTFALAQVNDTVKIHMNVQLVTNPGSTFEKYTPIGHPSWGTYIQSLSPRFYGFVGYGIVVYQIGKDFEIGHIYKNSNAYNSGLMKQDRIIKVNGKKVHGLSVQELDSMFIPGDAGTEIELVVRHRNKGPECAFVLKKAFIEPEFKPDLIKDEEQRDNKQPDNQ
jgi:hypothetical protein